MILFTHALTYTFSCGLEEKNNFPFPETARKSLQRQQPILIRSTLPVPHKQNSLPIPGGNTPIHAAFGAAIKFRTIITQDRTR